MSSGVGWRFGDSVGIVKSENYRYNSFPMYSDMKIKRGIDVIDTFINKNLFVKEINIKGKNSFAVLVEQHYLNKDVPGLLDFMVFKYEFFLYIDVNFIYHKSCLLTEKKRKDVTKERGHYKL